MRDSRSQSRRVGTRSSGSVRAARGGARRRPRASRGGWAGRSALVELVLGDDPGASIDALLQALRGGASEVELASAVSFAAATRIARFPTSNEFGDWDTALHTFTLANAVERAALPLVAAARYLAAHATTTRSQRQTFDIARRLHRGEKLYEEAA